MPYLPEVPQHHGDATRIVERGFGLTDNCTCSGLLLAARRVERPRFHLMNVRDMMRKKCLRRWYESEQHAFRTTLPNLAHTP